MSTQNKHATIRSRITKNGKLRTETHRRDEGSLEASVSTHLDTNSTVMFIDLPESDLPVRLSGREAKTLYRLLSQHYDCV